MANCQHCGQGAIARDAYGPVCPDCAEEGQFEPNKHGIFVSSLLGFFLVGWLYGDINICDKD